MEIVNTFTQINNTIITNELVVPIYFVIVANIIYDVSYYFKFN